MPPTALLSQMRFASSASQINLSQRLQALWLAKIPNCRGIKQMNCGPASCENRLMLRLLSILSARFFRSRRDLLWKIWLFGNSLPF